MKLKLVTAFFYFFLVLSFTIQSQTSKKTDSISQKSFDEIMDLFYDSKPDTLKATFYANAYFKKGLKEKDTMAMVLGKKLLADINNNENIYLTFCDSLINTSNKKQNRDIIVKIHINKARFFITHGENSNAQKELLLAYKKNKNKLLQNYIYLYTGILKSKIYKYDEAIFYLKKAYNYAFRNEIFENNIAFIALPISISSCYEKLNMLDSSTLYINKGIKKFKNLNDNTLLGNSFYIKAKIEFKKEEYNESTYYFKKVIPSIIKDEYFFLLMEVYIYLGEISNLKNNQKEALKYHLKSDSLYLTKNIKNSRLEKSYLYLLKNAKQNKNLEKQLLYTERLLEIKEFSLTEKNKVTTTFIEEYDIPNLIKEKEVLQLKINEEKNYKIIFYFVIVIFLILLVYQIRKKKFYRKQFEKIIHKKEEVIVNRPKEIIKKSTSQISDEIVNAILEKLILFEKNKDFLKPDINLSNLANTIDTNSNYLSKIVNQHKNTSFSNYINELRINYVIEQLKTDKVLRKYTIKAIANDVGYKNVESFSKAFYKYTQLKPSYFIKELEKS